MKWVLIALLRAYRAVISPLYGEVCRYYPSCSAYALEAVRTHGSVKGSWLAARRLVRCHPWAAGGVDHVPPATPSSRGRNRAARCEHIEQGV
ncbi:membrane protein insertion efficiency factor YidD [Nocardioides sp. MH1]|uniref:membrane protein insertion efficiency factor YidD n=1 Tax=Nocardioides sp. MH1 TaxID=3242490 RepID=UPI00351FCCC9